MSCQQMVSTELCFSITNRDLKCAVKSASYSKTYIKKIVKASLLNILYHRMNVDEKQFQQKSYDGIPFVTFKPKATDQCIRKFHDWMYGFSDALNKGYIKDVYLFMLDNDSTLIEKYKFHLKYTEEHQKTPVESASLSEATKDFLKTLALLADHPKLAPETQLHVEFAYYDTTPQDYEPPGFEASVEGLALRADDTPMTVFLGRLETGYHTLKCSARGKVFSTTPSATPAPSVIANKTVEVEEAVDDDDEADDKSEVYMLEDDTSKAMVNGNEEESEYFLANTTKPAPDSECIAMSDKSIDIHQDIDYVNITLGSDETNNSVVALPNTVVECLCRIHVFIADIDLIKCVTCKKQYHAPCHGYYDKSCLVGCKFVCVLCDKHNTEDKLLSQMPVNEYALFASTRLFLLLIQRLGRFPTDIMRLIPKKRVVLIMKKLKSTGAIVKTSDGGVEINQINLTHYIISFFIQRDSQVLNTETQDYDIPLKKRRGCK